MENRRELFQLLTRSFGILNKNCCSIGNIEISPIHSHILYEVDRQTNPSMQQIADTLAIDITTFSRQIQTLIKMDLVKKTPAPSDKRSSILSLTATGESVAQEIDQSMEAYLDEVFSHMNDFEQDTVLRSIQLLNEAIRKSSVCCTPPY